MVASQYFDPTPSSRSQPTDITVGLADLTLRLTTDHGVFSHGALDAGTRFLLQEAPDPGVIATALDLGCGYGAIACALAKRAPNATVTAVDINERARALCAANAHANGCANVVVCAPDDVPVDTRFDLIWSNPPIRIGKPALHELLAQWLPRLTPTGRAILVVQKHLGADSLLAWLNQQPWLAPFSAQKLKLRQGYRLIEIHA
jgi:16S rRNA (guanine1207-N2)-methyltransferase